MDTIMNRIGINSFTALIIVPTLDLKDQWERMLREQGLFDNAVIITYARAGRLMDEGDEDWFGAFQLLVFDEVHHLAEGQQWRQLLIPAFKAKYALGLTATPPTDPENVLLQVMPVVFERTYQEGLDEGYAAPIEVRPVGVQLTDEERKRYAELTEEIRIAIVEAGSVERAVRWRGNVFTERKQLVANAAAKFEKALTILRAMDAQDHPTRIFIWSEYISVLENAHIYLQANGVTSAFLHGEVPKKVRRDTWKAWGKEFQVLLIGKLGEEGIDVPEVAHGIIIAGAKTSRQNVQRLGRLLRPMPGKKALLYLVFAEKTTEENLVYMMDKITE